jgi:endonuclease YncB( thermonuclease family)
MPMICPDHRWRHALPVTMVLVTCSLPGIWPARAQGLDMDANMPARASGQSGSLDTDVNPSAPMAAAPALQPSPRKDMPIGVGSLNAKVTPDVQHSPEGMVSDPLSRRAMVTAPGTPPAVAQQAVPVTLDHPKVTDTASLQAGDTTISLYGIEGLAGPAAQGLQAFITAGDGRVTCQALSGGSFVCLMSDGTNLAQVALVNGAARTAPDAPDSYRDQEAAAQAARRGIWVNLPPPPETFVHPIVRDTATLWANGKTFVLDGMAGFQVPYSTQLQGYIAANGDSMTCAPQSDPGHYVCLLPDGTDVAKVALVNGAARVGPDAPDAYRVQQLDALNYRRGYWATAPDAVIAAAMPPPEPGDRYTLVAGDDGADGVTYIGGAPVATIEGESVFLVYGDDLGWGYYDHYHHWHGAPDRYRNHMEHFHPDGHGLRSYDGFHHDAMTRGHAEATRHDAMMRGHAEATRHDAMMRGGEEAMRRDNGLRGHQETMRHDAGTYAHEEGIHSGMAGPTGRPGIAGPAAHPGNAGPAGAARIAEPAGHPGIVGPPAMGASAGVGHPGNIAMATGHPATTGGAPGGGFLHPAPPASAGGFHPGMTAPVINGATPAVHAVAPAPHVAAPSGGGEKHK